MAGGRLTHLCLEKQAMPIKTESRSFKKLRLSEQMPGTLKAPGI